MNVTVESQRNKRSLGTKDMAYISMFTAIIAICAWISIPTAIPFTMQTFGVFVAVGILGMKRGTLAVMSYVLLGVIGIPVFEGFTGGIGVLMGNTGGYLVGFIASALVTGGLLKVWSKSLVGMVISMMIGLIVCYFFGIIGFMFFYSRSQDAIGIATAISWCATPYIIPDTIKIALAIIITRRVQRSIAL